MFEHTTNIKAAPLLEAQQELQLARAAKAGSAEAFDRLVRAYVPLVYAITRELSRHAGPSDDLISEGFLGLVEATRRFDPDRGVRLATYAAFWIRAFVRRYSIFNRRIVRPPSSRGARRVLAHLSRTQATLHSRDGHAPSHEAIATELAVPCREVDDIVTALSGYDVPYDVNGQLGSVELSSDDPSPEALLADSEEQALRARALARALDRLDRRENEIVRRRHLMSVSASLQTIGDELGISGERVRQLEHGAQKSCGAL